MIVQKYAIYGKDHVLASPEDVDFWSDCLWYLGKEYVMGKNGPFVDFDWHNDEERLAKEGNEALKDMENYEGGLDDSFTKMMAKMTM
mmetsp:Transcript_26862/g.44259  ORF Transcript_26862/g.44259 Transcript_26862/m.44259 type:complete len:87 (-) Transcript_26862:1853-2113(-)|eukprot:CAMPEP_0178743944 /NCGR_PEP_ID=MMETSP0744-20121128/6479_1 /TAXON_ID=913974 /ORGANISM="Nitzschia punctata, Strain CCMP561" /LENGTH=86 /DNA_ID=CAMNT_0020396989 /DNA_START=352 /DNA_END=612 /DNA_ORIENTATION=+